MSDDTLLQQVLREEALASATEEKLARLVAAVKKDRENRPPLAADAGNCFQFFIVILFLLSFLFFFRF